jgi:hypothetical protein
MITSFPFDYMHSVLLGVTRRIIWLWLESPFDKGFRIDGSTSLEIGNLIVSDAVQSALKCSFPRAIRSWSDYKSWKASEFRDFLLYVGPVVLRGRLSSAYYLNFMHLSVAIYILCHPRLHLPYNQYADSLLRSFVRQYFDLYGPGQMTYNVHSLCHLSSDVQRHGTLDSFSAFPFESYIGKLKRMLKNAVRPDTQICRRIAESRVVATLINKDESISVCMDGDYRENPVVKVRGITYSCKYPNKVCIANGVPHQIVGVNTENGETVVLTKKYRMTTNLYDFGMPSSTFLVCSCSQEVQPEVLHIHPKTIVCKCIPFIFSQQVTAIPLLHTF